MGVLSLEETPELLIEGQLMSRIGYGEATQC
jgi:hypothetical protein